MKNYALVIGLAIPLFTGIANADVVQIQYTDTTGTATAKKGAPYYINPQSTFKAGFSAGVGRKIAAEIKDANGVVVDSQTKSRVENSDTFVVDGVTYYGSEFEFNKLADGKYTLTSIVYNSSQAEVSRQNNDLFIDTAEPQINGDFYWNPFGMYVHKHSDGKFIASRAGIQDAGFPSITVGSSGFSHATFSAEYLDGPKVGTKHVTDAPALVTSQGKLIIGNGAPNSISNVYIPDNTANQMRLTYTIFNKVGRSSSKSIDLYVATKQGQKPTPYGVYTGVPTKLDGVTAFNGFETYVAGMTIPSNPVRMIYRAPKDMYIGGGGNADIYGGWLNGSRGPNKVVHTDSQYIYFDVTGSSDGTQYNSIQLYTRDVSTWRTHQLQHDVVIPSGLEPPKALQYNFYIQGLAKWVNSTGASSYQITKSETGGINDSITKIKLVVEPRNYDQKHSFDFGYVNSSYKGSCVIPSGETECVMTTSLAYPADDVQIYHNRIPVSNLSGTLLGTEIVQTWQYDGSLAELDPSSVNHDTQAKKISFAFINKFSDRIYGSSAIRKLDAYAVDSKGIKTKLTRTNFVTNAINTSTSSVTGEYVYSSLKDGVYSFEALVEDGFNTTKVNSKTHTLFSNIVIDTTPPTVSTNIKNQTVMSLSGIEISANDTGLVKIKSAVLTGGIDGVNISLPVVAKGSNLFKIEHVYISPSDKQLYTMTIIVEDGFGNTNTKVETFYYIPKIVPLPDIKQPAISSPLKSENGLPSNVIKTPQLKNDAGELAVGNHDVVFTLLPTAESAMVVNGKTVSPGESHEFTVNLSQTNHRLIFEAYPAVSGQEVSNKYEINVADIRVSICPDQFTLASGQCIHLSVVDPILKCNQPYALTDGQCELEVIYDPSTTCMNGYTLDGTLCRGSYTVDPLTVCSPDYSLVDNATCKKVQTIALKVCPDGQTVEEGFCKDSNGITSPQKQYCQGKEISGGSFCDAGTCYDYKKDWNACQVSTTIPSTEVCQVGSLSAGKCQVTDQYQLNMQCPFGFNRDGILCKRIEIISPIKSCDSGFTLSGNNCIKTETSQYMGCPATHVLIDGRCHEKEPIKITCPSNYDWNGTKCINDQQSPAVPLCPSDFTFNGTLCQKDDIVSATGQCSPGQIWVGSSCNETLTTPATPVCSDGLTWNGTECYLKETQPGTLGCGSGYTWNGTTCARIDSINATYGCPSSYTWNSLKSVCERSASQPAVAQCASGYTLNSGGLCEKTETTSPIKQCSPGFTFDGTTCSKTETQTATKQCQTGYTLTSDSTQCQSVQTTSSTSSCPSGYTWDGTICRSGYTTGVRPTGFTCPINNYASPYPTAAFQNVCQSTRPVDCPAGYGTNPEDDAHCYASNFTPSYGGPCPSSAPYKFVDNNYQCSSLPGQTWTKAGSCPSGYTQNNVYGCINNTKTASIGYHCCEPGLNYNASTGLMDGYITSPKVDKCASGYTYQGGGVCSKTETAAFTLSCQSGWMLVGNNCTKSTTELPTDTCNIGWSLNGNICTQLVTQPPISYSCTTGWTLSGTSCSGFETTVREYSCSSDRTLVGTKCEKTLTQGRIWRCPTGWTGTSLCTKITRDPPSEYQCPVDWSVNGSQCDQVVKHAPSSYTCDPGWVNETDKCRLTTTAPVSSHQCDVGWTLDGSTCRIRYYEIENRSCNAAYTQIDSTSCYYNVPATSVGDCPVGFTSNVTNCTKSLIEPVTLSCNQNYELIADQCHTTIEQNVTVECQSGEEIRDGKCVLIKKHIPKMACESPYELEASQCKNEVKVPALN